MHFMTHVDNFRQWRHDVNEKTYRFDFFENFLHSMTVMKTALIK